jgi:hypothetical protein
MVAAPAVVVSTVTFLAQVHVACSSSSGGHGVSRTNAPVLVAKFQHPTRTGLVGVFSEISLCYSDLRVIATVALNKLSTGVNQ